MSFSSLIAFCHLHVDRNGLNMRPRPFPCRFTPRSAEIKAAIELEAKQAIDELSIYERDTAYRMSQFQKKKT